MSLEVSFRADPRALHPDYVGASPFPHIVIDDLFPDPTLEAVLAAFPKADQIAWSRFENKTEKKLGYSYKTELDPVLQEFLWRMNAPPALEFLECLTGIEGLIPDPYFGGAGPHQILPGGYLAVHADFNWHPKMKLDRRLNLLVYLNKDWRDEYGGHLELWNADVSSCGQRILPLFNRTVVFSTTDTSFHGHPRPLACPPDRSRKSMSLYYYTNGRPEEERSAPHDTIFKATPHDHDED